MFYTVYKITNLINEKIYIGCHKTTNLDDGYMGSGIYITNAIKKHGIENFEKEILEIFDNAESMFEMESILVNSEFVDRDDTYNLKEGGNGGFEYINTIGKNHKFTVEESSKGGIKTSGLFKEKSLEEIEKFYENRLQKVIEYYENGGVNGFKGKFHSVETKKKIGETNAKHQQGERNSQYGTMWIYSLAEKVSKKINKEDFSDWETKGWTKGRKIKFF